MTASAKRIFIPGSRPLTEPEHKEILRVRLIGVN